MKRTFISLAVLTTILCCTSCASSEDTRKSMYETFSSPTEEYKEFCTAVSTAQGCDPWDICIVKDKEYSVKTDKKRGNLVVGKKDVPTYKVRIEGIGESDVIYAEDKYTTTFELNSTKISLEPAKNGTFCGYSGEEISYLFEHRNR